MLQCFTRETTVRWLTAFVGKIKNIDKCRITSENFKWSFMNSNSA